MMSDKHSQNKSISYINESTIWTATGMIPKQLDDETPNLTCTVFIVSHGQTTYFSVIGWGRKRVWNTEY